ncbi:MAG: MBL fold metallo-hydrolase [Pseudomonadota bacterium]
MTLIDPVPAAAAGAIALTLVLPADAAADTPLEVHSYASQVRDVDSVNSHWFETEDGVVLIDAQRLLPAAERALAHLRATTSKPVTAIVVSHAHTDHYGGLPVWLEAFPDATVYTDATTLGSIREDGRGFIAARTERHGDAFATQESLDAAVADAVVLAPGDRLKIGEHTLAIDVFGPSEAESTVIVSIEDQDITFIGDLINVGAPAVPFEDIDAWLAQLDAIEARFGDDILHIGHGPSPAGIDALVEQRRFLTALRAKVADALANDGAVDPVEVDAIVFALEAEWPFLQGVAGNTRREILAFAATRVAGQLGGEVREATRASLE